MDITDEKIENLKKAINSHKEYMALQEYADDFYFTGARRQDLEILRNLEEQLKSLEKIPH